MTDKKPGVGVVVGRFQVPSLSQGHIDLLRVAEMHQAFCVIVGVAPFPSPVNPLSFDSRRAMIQQRFPSATIVMKRDESDDDTWSHHLDLDLKALYPSLDITLYGGRDSFVRYYSGRLRTVVIPDWSWNTPSGTEIRASVSEVDSDAYRSGVIAGMPRPRVFPVVDMAGLCDNDSAVLLVKRSHEQAWRFPGGFVDPGDASYVTAAQREFFEETGVGLICPRLLIEDGVRIDDWRFRGTGNAVISMPYIGRIDKEPECGGRHDDVDDVEKIPIDALLNAVVPEHRIIASLVIQRGTEGWLDKS